jgi:predicted oxidoreductase
MRIVGEGGSEDRARGKRALHTAVENGYSLFDHADIYGGGECEALFGEFLAESPSIRDEITIATKCGIRLPGDPGPEAPARYDFRHDYIMKCVEGSLGRLGVEQVELFLLHRPDYLMDADEVAQVFDDLHSSGKVANFGVSNFSTTQVDLLRSRLSVPLIVNQVEINIHNISALTNGTLDQCQQLGITPQAWCPVAGVAYPAWGNAFTEDDDHRIRAELDRQTQRYGAEDWQIALAWLLTHPANISPIIGSTTPSRIAAATNALDIDYRRDDWYRLLEARNGQSVP